MKLISFIKKIIDRLIPEKRRKFMRLCGLLPIDRKKAVFVSFLGKGCNDNPRAIFEEMVRQRPNMHFVWLMKDPNTQIKHAKTVRYDSLRALYHLATAHLWVDNCRKDHWIPKRKGQYYVQTWHGNVAIKKVEKDAEELLSEHYIRCCHHDSEMADVFISGCKWRTDNYRSAFWYDGEILELGYPYSDILYTDKQLMHEKLCRFFSLPSTAKLCMYAPTFRKNENLDCYDLDTKRVLDALHKRWGGDWIILLRLHPNVSEKNTMLHYSDRVLNATAYDEVNELTLGTDLLISDYSSVMIDALEAKTKTILYASDYADYCKDRDLYFKLKELPFAFCESNDALIEEILHFDEELAAVKAKHFYEQLGFFNGADSSKKVAKYILEKL